MGSTKKCKACNKEMDGNKRASREHILPLWLHPYVKTDGIALERFKMEEYTRRSLYARHELNTYVVRSVCAECNNGWMSQLEVEAAPILTPLITAQCKIDSLSRLECLTLAKWTYKTVFMMLSAQRDVDVPWRFLNLWYENRIQNPDPAIIFALTELSLPKAFYYCIDTDHFTDVDSGPFNIRVGICINSLILIALIPSNDDPRQPGAPVLLNSPVSYRATLASGSRDYSDSAIFTKE